MLVKILVIVLVSFVASSSGKLLDVSKLDLTNVNCTASANIIDECSLQQGYSFRHREVPYPQTTSVLMANCKRSTESLKCLRAYSKCLPPLTKQIMNAMVQTRKAHNKRLCTDLQSEATTKFLQANQCCQNNRACLDKGAQAEFNSIALTEAISAAKMSVDERLKYSCCTVAVIRREFLEAFQPHCKQHTHVMAQIVDSYIAETIGLVCPDFNSPKPRFDCNKLVPLNVAKVVNSLYFVQPIINVMQYLQSSN